MSILLPSVLIIGCINLIKPFLIQFLMYIIFTIGLTCICSLLLDNFNDYEQTIVLYMTAITVITVFFYMYASTTIKIGYCYMIGFLLMALVCILGFYTLYFEKKTYNTLYFLIIFIVVYSFYIMC